MRVIHKFALPEGHDGICDIPMPLEFLILRVDAQHGRPVVWIMLDPDEKKVWRVRIYSRATGGTMPSGPGGKYIGTAICDDGALVWHYFSRWFEIEEAP